MGRISTKFNRLRRVATAATFVFALVASSFAGITPAYAAGGTATWTGGAGDRLFSTPGNWAENAIPEDGDVLVFNTASYPDGDDWAETLDNDIDVTFSGVTSNPVDEESYSGYSLSNILNLEAGATWNVNSRLPVGSAAGVHVAGDLTLLQAINSDSLTVEGALTVSDGVGITSLPSAQSFIIENGAEVYCLLPPPGTEETINQSIVLGGGTGVDAPVLWVQACSGAVGVTPDPSTLILSSVELLGHAEIAVFGENTVKVEHLVDNDFSLTRTASSTGTLITPDGTQDQEPKETRLTGNFPNEDYAVQPLEVAVLAGTRGFVSVQQRGVLKGEGVVRALSVQGVLTPGNSAGTITALQSLMLWDTASFEVELLNTDEYDQVIVAGEGDESTPVFLGGTLRLSLLPGAEITQGDTFTIIDNRSEQPVQGTFEGLEEGARIHVGDAVFSISYIGGNGNDVVLTALTAASAPGTPNTGFRAALSSPVLVAALGLLAATTLFVAQRRFAREKA